MHQLSVKKNKIKFKKKKLTHSHPYTQIVNSPAPRNPREDHSISHAIQQTEGGRGRSEPERLSRSGDGHEAPARVLGGRHLLQMSPRGITL